MSDCWNPVDPTSFAFVKLPTDWKATPLKYVMPRLESGVSVNAADRPVSADSIGVLKTSCVYGDTFRAEENKEVVLEEHVRVACPVSAHSLIISRMNTPDLVGSCGFVEQNHPNLFLPDRLWIARFTSAEKALPRFIWYLLISKPIKAMMSLLATGTSGSMKNLSQRDFMRIVVPIPPLTEQRAVADFLDRETARIDELRDAHKRVILLLAEQKSAIIEALARGKGLFDLIGSANDWLGQVPMRWEVLPLRRRAIRIQTGTTPPTSEESYYTDGEIPWYGPGSFGAALVLGEPVKLLHRSAIADGVARLFEAGSTFIVTIGATLGKVGYIEQDASANQQITAITFDPSRVFPKFAAFQLKILEPVLRGISPSSTLPILDQQEVGSLPLALPSLETQAKIVVDIEQECLKIAAMTTKAKESITKLTEYRSALISAAVTGEIDVRNYRPQEGAALCQ